MKLKSRDKWVPGGFQMVHPEAGQERPWSGSFNEIVRKELDFRTRNPALVEKNGWSLDPDDVANDVDTYNAQRMLAAGYLGFVELEGETPGLKKKSSTGLFRNAVGVVGKAKTALAMYRDMFGPSGTVVPIAEAERRAAVCLDCPEHDTTGGLQKYFVKEAAREIMGLFGMLKDMEVKTSVDDKLGICPICSCPMRAKVFVESDMIKKNMKSEEIAKLPPNCWIPQVIGLTEIRQS